MQCQLTAKFSCDVIYWAANRLTLGRLEPQSPTELSVQEVTDTRGLERGDVDRRLGEEDRRLGEEDRRLGGEDCRFSAN